MGVKDNKVLSRLKEFRRRFAPSFLMGSFMAVLWLMSALENGSGSAWTMYSIAGIVLIWVFLIGFESWRERDKSRREHRCSSRIKDKVLNEQAKRNYIREALAA